MNDETNVKQWFTSVLHPTDFSAASDTAFAHALAIAVVGRAQFTMMHVGHGTASERPWGEFPQVRETLARWGLLNPDSAPEDVFVQLGMAVQKVEAHDLNPVQAIVEYAERHAPDLLVLATEGREGLPRWLKPSVAESLARRSRVVTLFVPQGSEGFVPLDTANINLKRILIPIDEQPDATAAIELAARWGEVLSKDAEITLLHLGPSIKAIEHYAPYGEPEGWSLIHRTGDIVDGIVQAARSERADLIVMPTSGHEGFLDMLRGSISEQVLRRAPCPVLAVPAGHD